MLDFILSTLLGFAEITAMLAILLALVCLMAWLFRGRDLPPMPQSLVKIGYGIVITFTIVFAITFIWLMGDTVRHPERYNHVHQNDAGLHR